MLDIEKDIAGKYGIIIESIVPFRDTFILNTADGKKVLKNTGLSSERILFIHSVKEHLYNNNFKNLDRYCRTLDGLPFIQVENGIYTVSEMIEGRECNFDNPSDVADAARLLGYLHKCSRGYFPAENIISRCDLGKLPSFFVKRLEELKKLKKLAKKGRSKFDHMFLEYFDYFFNMGEESIRQIYDPRYDNLVRISKKEGIICHHDFTHHNILCGENSISLINFEFCSIEVKVYDIANFLRRKMRKCSWDIKEAKMIINEYRKIEGISKDEFYVMKIMLQFPQKLWRVANRYYNSKRSWSEKSFMGKLQEVIDEIECHKNFLDKFDILI